MKERLTAIPTKTALWWQGFAFVCAFFSCSFVTGLEGLFAAFTAACCASLLLAGVGPLSLLSAAAGALLGYAFALWSENGGIVNAVIDAPMFDNTVEFTLDLRILGALWLVTLAAMIAVSVYTVKKGAARTVCVAANTFLLVLSRLAAGVWILRAKYGVFDWELLREKLDLLGRSLGNYLWNSLQGTALPGEARDPSAVLALGSSMAYTLPLIFLVLCGVYAFLQSFVMKRLLKKAKVFSEEQNWVFLPTLTSAFVYLAITVISFAYNSFEPYHPASYGLELLEGFLSWLFFVPGLTALRVLLAGRRSGRRRFPWLIPLVFLVMFPAFIGVVLNLVPTVGLIFAVVVGFRQRAAEKNNLK